MGGVRQTDRRCQEVEERNEEVQIDSAMKVLATEGTENTDFFILGREKAQNSQKFQTRIYTVFFYCLTI